MRSPLLLKRALDYAAVWHRDQRRKYPDDPAKSPPGGVPYVAHVAGVALVLARHGFDDEVVAAGALHDVMEDCGVTKETLEALFGARVAELVRHASEEDKTLSWEERKRAYVEHFGTKPWDAQAITLADKIDNFWSIVRCAKDFGDPWPMFKRGREAQLARFDAIAQKARALPPHALIEDYLAALEAVRAV
jgi:(p)ppGpp synthase/HD superfamily hydrolase